MSEEQAEYTVQQTETAVTASNSTDSVPDLEQRYSHEGSEMALLSMLFADPQGVHDISNLLSPADFSNPHYREIYQAIRHLIFSEGAFDSAALELALAKNAPKVHHAKWQAMIIMLQGAYAGTVDQMKRHAITIADKAVRRRMSQLPNKLISLSQNPLLNTEQILSQAEDYIYGLRGDRLFVTESLQLAASRYMDELGERFNTGEDAARIMTGYQDIDNILWGFRSGKPYVLGARPGIGKSTLGLDIADKVAKYQRVLMFSIEMDDTEMAEKRLSAIAGVDLKKLTFTSRMTAFEYQDVLKALAYVSDNIIVDYNPAPSMDYIRSVSMREHAKNTLGMIIIDHFHRIATTDSRNPTEAYNQTAKKISILYKQLNVAGITLAQLNRNLESRADKRPILSDLKATGALEEEAYGVLFIHRDKETPHIADIEIAKNRGGPTGTAQLLFDGKHSRFVPMAREGIEYQAEEYEPMEF